jgi:hypothetical protein
MKESIYYYIAMGIFLLTFATFSLTVYGLLKFAEFFNISLGETIAVIYYGDYNYVSWTRGSFGEFFNTSWSGIDNVLNYVFIQANGIIVGLIMAGFFLFISEYSNE